MQRNSERPLLFSLPSFADVVFWFLVLVTDEKCLTVVLIREDSIRE